MRCGLSYTYTGGIFCGIGLFTGILNIDFHLKINGSVTNCKREDLDTACVDELIDELQGERCKVIRKRQLPGDLLVWICFWDSVHLENSLDHGYAIVEIDTNRRNERIR